MKTPITFNNSTSMKSIIAIKFIIIFLSISPAFAQDGPAASTKEGPFINASEPSSSANKSQQVVKITGVRFAYPLVQKWIDSFNKEYPDVQIIIEPRGSADPSSDILIEAIWLQT